MKNRFSFTTAFLFSFGALLFLSLIFANCSKKESKESNETEKHCPPIAATAVPKAVKDSFAIRYPSMTVITWFQKDSLGFCAYFIQPVNQKKLAEFTRSGSFIAEEIDINHDGNFEDSTGHAGIKNPDVCECEIPE